MKNQPWRMIFLLLIGTLLIINLVATIIDMSKPSYANPNTKFRNLQFSGSLGGFWLFDATNGDIWVYEKGKAEYVGTLKQPGKNLEQRK